MQKYIGNNVLGKGPGHFPGYRPIMDLIHFWFWQGSKPEHPPQPGRQYAAMPPTVHSCHVPHSVRIIPCNLQMLSLASAYVYLCMCACACACLYLCVCTSLYLHVCVCVELVESCASERLLAAHNIDAHSLIARTQLRHTLPLLQQRLRCLPFLHLLSFPFSLFIHTPRFPLFSSFLFLLIPFSSFPATLKNPCGLQSVGNPAGHSVGHGSASRIRKRLIWKMIHL